MIPEDPPASRSGADRVSRIMAPAPTARLARALATSLLALACCACGDRPAEHGAAANPEGRPSFVLIVADDLDSDLGSMEVMPRARRLIADQGVELTSHFVSTPLCCPSRTTLFTGQYTHHHRVYRNRGRTGGFHRFQRLGLEQQTLALALQRHGYRTALVGKYLNEYKGVYVPPGWNEWVAASADAYNGFGYALSVNGKREVHHKNPSDYTTDVLAARAEAFLAAQRPGAPFFLYFAPLAPHPPATPAPRHAGLFGDRAIPRTAAFNEPDVSDKAPGLRDRPPLSTADVAALDEHYRRRLRSLQALDEAIERLDAVLRKRGLSDSTYVIFTSDNGFHMGQHRLPFGKGTAYEEDIHVPLYVRGPGVRAGAKEARLTSSADLPVTLAELAGAPLPNADGRSLRPLWESAAEVAWRQFVLIENFQAGDDEGQRADPAAVPAQVRAAVPLVSALRGARAKYVELAGGKWTELYRLDADPHELDNAAACLPAGERRQLADLLHAMAACRGEECRRVEETALPDLALEKPAPRPGRPRRAAPTGRLEGISPSCP
jgi:N-acetylglucosamine-6-sulfatase